MHSRCLPLGRHFPSKWRSAGAALGLAVLGITPDVSAIVRRHDISDSLYIALGNDFKYVSVASIQDATHTTATGTLISPKWVLTAGHVVIPRPGINGAPVSINIGGTTDANGTTYNAIQSFSPYTGDPTTGNDVGLIQLSAPVSGITPATRWFGASEVGMIGTYLGFGDPGTGLSGPSPESPRLKRGMTNRLDGTGALLLNNGVPYSSNILLSDFDDPGNADGYNWLGTIVPPNEAPNEGLVAGGDSGGGVFVQQTGNPRWYVSSVTAFVTAVPTPFGNGGTPGTGFPLFIYADVNASTRVSAHNIWIDDNITNNWKTAASGSFNTAGNWSVGTYTSGTPGAGDLAGFNAVGSYTVTFGSNVSNHMLLARRGDVTLDLNGSTYDLTSTMFEGAMVVGRYSGNDASVTFRNGTVNTTGGDVILGQMTGSTGRLRIGPSAAVNVNGTVYVGGGFDGAAGSGVLSILDNTSALNVAGSLKVRSTGMVNFEHGSLNAGAIEIDSGGQMNLSPGADKIIQTSSLAISGTGVLDMSDNDMLIEYVTSPDSTIRQYLKAGRIISSAATSLLGLGYGDNALLGRSEFDGISIGAQAELVKYTYFGDTDLDGDVDKADLGRMALAWHTAGDWIGGDFDYSGFVDVADLAKLALNWLQGVGDPIGPSLGPSFGEALAEAGLPISVSAIPVPEPSVLASLGIAASLLLRRRKTAASSASH